METGHASHIEANGYYWSEQKCPICEIPPARYLGRRGGAAHREHAGVETEIWTCGECGLLFPNPMPVPAGGLDQHYAVEADSYFVGHEKQSKIDNARNLVERAERVRRGKGRLLDVGVGRGEILLAAKQLGWDAEGVEPSEQFADYAEEKTGAPIWRMPIEQADIPENSFDVIILAAVLEHLYDPDAVIAKIAALLKTGGVLYVDVPNEKGLYFRVGNLYQKIRRRDWCVNLAPTFSPYHLFGFNLKALHRLLKKHGLQPVEWEVVGGQSMVAPRQGIVGKLESAASSLVTKLSAYGEMGTYIETWARKV